MSDASIRMMTSSDRPALNPGSASSQPPFELPDEVLLKIQDYVRAQEAVESVRPQDRTKLAAVNRQWCRVSHDESLKKYEQITFEQLLEKLKEDKTADEKKYPHTNQPSYSSGNVYFLRRLSDRQKEIAYLQFKKYYAIYRAIYNRMSFDDILVYFIRDLVKVLGSFQGNKDIQGNGDKKISVATKKIVQDLLDFLKKYDKKSTLYALAISASLLALTILGIIHGAFLLNLFKNAILSSNNLVLTSLGCLAAIIAIGLEFGALAVSGVLTPYLFITFLIDLYQNHQTNKKLNELKF